MPIAVSPFTRLLMDEIQIAALLFMAVTYVLKIRWILKFTPARERTPSRGDEAKAIRFSFLTLAAPWELPSARRYPFRWTEFALFHVAVAVAIALTIVMPYWPKAVGSQAAVLALQVVFGVGTLVAAGWGSSPGTRGESF